jgi:methionine sulfoxide reductase heme-binding subunit
VRVRSALRGATLAIGAVLLALLVFGTTLEGAQAAARWTARVSFLLFALAFVGPSWSRLFPSAPARVVAGQEWPFTLAFAGSHLVHLAALLVYVSLRGEGLDPVRLAGGMLGYALLLLVLFRPAARSWAFFYLWFVFLMTYLPRVRGTLPGAGGAPWTFPLFLSLVVLVLAVRLGASVRGAPLLKEG